MTSDLPREIWGWWRAFPLLLASLMTIPFAKLVNGEKIPLVVLIAVLTNALGLFLTFLCIKSPGGRECGGAVFRKKSAGIPLCFPDWNRVCADHADRNDLGARSVSRGEQRTAGGAAGYLFHADPHADRYFPWEM